MNENKITFSQLGLHNTLLKALNHLGYMTPSPIQEKCIPPLLSGKDVLGLAQTGSGKTAAFSLPLLHNINTHLKEPQILILTPTRELAIQVSKAIMSFSTFMNNTVRILSIYGGQNYDIQLQGLRKGPQIIVGTPGRLLDHLKRKTLNLKSLRSVVLDEADEMLKMGFIEDVETIMSNFPKKHQTALFSATMPEPILRITKRFMNTPQEIRIKSNITTRPDINQNYWIAFGNKTNALIRFLELESFDAAIIFVRTKNATTEVSESLERIGYKSSALNGDMNQKLREQTLERLKKNHLDILVATDIAARGLDVERISLVINYDSPINVESYVHRIGRTGRAGRRGRAILFIGNNEKRLLKNIERVLKTNINEIKLPDAKSLGKKRFEKFKNNVISHLEDTDLALYKNFLHQIKIDKKIDTETLATILLKIAQETRPLILPEDHAYTYQKIKNRFNVNYQDKKSYRDYNKMHNMALYRMEIGKEDGVEVRHIIGVMINKFEINSRHIGNVKLFNTHSLVELPKQSEKNFSKVRILNKVVNIQFVRNIMSTNNNRDYRRVYKRNVHSTSSYKKNINCLHQRKEKNNNTINNNSLL